MTVQELFEQMKELIAGGHADKEVKFAYNYGDHWHTSVAADINTVSEARVKYSDYHSMDKIVDDAQDDDDCEMTPKPDTRAVIILD